MKYYEMTSPADPSRVLRLRLTSRALAAFCQAHGIPGASPVVSVLAAADDVDKEAALFRAALNWPGSENGIRDGYDLIDAMTDAGQTSVQRRQAVAQIAVSSGLWTGDEGELLRALEDGAQATARAVLDVISGKRTEGSEAEAAENPTPTTGK